MTLDQVVAAVRQDGPPALNPILVAGCLLELAEAEVVEVLQTAGWSVRVSG